MKAVLFVAVAAMIAACASTNATGGADILIAYQADDVPEQRRINLSYRNVFPHAICLGPENWPSSGVLLNPGDNVYIETQGKRFFLQPEQDYCPKCRKRVASGEVILDFLNYESFDLPPSMFKAPKRLSLKSVGIACK